MTDSPQQPEPPKPVLPLGTLAQAEGDSRVGRFVIFGLFILIIVGLVAVVHGGLPAGMNAIVFFVVMLAVAIAVIMSIPRNSAHESFAVDNPSTIVQRSATDRILEYGRPPARHTARKVARAVGGFGLFIVGGVVGIGAMLGLASLTRDPMISICGPVLIGVVLLFIPGVRTFAAGLVLSPALAFMIVFAICAGFR